MGEVVSLECDIKDLEANVEQCKRSRRAGLTGHVPEGRGRTLQRLRRERVKHMHRNPQENPSRCQFRDEGKKDARRAKKLRKQRNTRRTAIFKATTQTVPRRGGCLTFGTWDTRALGAPFGEDKEAKMHSIFALVAERRCNAALLKDLRFEEDGILDYRVGGHKWTLVHQGRVGVAMDEYLTSRWRRGRGRNWSRQKIGRMTPGHSG